MNVDTLKAKDAVLAALHNAENFDRAQFARWLDGKGVQLLQAVGRCPPHRLYEVDGKTCHVFAYRRDGGVVMREVGDQLQRDVIVDASSARDVTDELKRTYGLA